MGSAVSSVDFLTTDTMPVIGLTGGIASGKSTISDLFSALGVTIIDTDVISRTLLTPGQPGYTAVLQKMGTGILLAGEIIDRRELRQQIFNDTALKSWLESVLHPLIAQAARSRIAQSPQTTYCMLVVPLFFEANFRTLTDKVLVIDCKRSIQLKRLMHRDTISASLANQMLDQQWSNAERLSEADYVIHNQGDEPLKPQVDTLHQLYCAMSTATST